MSFKINELFHFQSKSHAANSARQLLSNIIWQTKNQNKWFQKTWQIRITSVLNQKFQIEFHIPKTSKQYFSWVHCQEIYRRSPIRAVFGFSGHHTNCGTTLIRDWSSTHCFEINIIHKRISTLQFYIPGFQNNPGYPKQKEFLKSNEGNLR